MTCFFKCFFFRKLDYLRWLFNSTISTTLPLHQYGRRIPNGMQKNRDALSRACWGNLWRRMTLDCQNSRKGWMALLRHSYARRTCAKRTFSDIVFMLFGSFWAFLQRWVREFGMFNYAWPEHSAWHICYYSYYMLYINLFQQFDSGLYLISRIEPYDLDLIWSSGMEIMKVEITHAGFADICSCTVKLWSQMNLKWYLVFLQV